MAWPRRLTLEMTSEGGTRPVADLVVYLRLDAGEGDDRWVGPFRSDARGEVALGREDVAGAGVDVAGRSKFLADVVAGSLRELREAVARREAADPEGARRLGAMLPGAANDEARTRVYKVFVSENFHRITIDVQASPSAAEVRGAGGDVVAIGGAPRA